ncbi:MAG: 6-bladed beta-propeller [Bacteroidales bacterium]
MRTQIFFLIALSACLCSCKNTKTGKQVDNPDLKTINIGESVGKGRIVNISEIATDIKYIPLETNKNSLIGTSSIVIYENGRIYVRFSRMLQVFDSTGKFLFTFNRNGRGPQEYIDGLIQIEKGTGNINVFESKGNIASIKRYSPEGTFLSNILLKNPVDLSTSRVEQLSNSLFLMRISNRITKNDIEYFALVVDTLSNIRQMIPTPDIKMNKSSVTKYVGNRVINNLGSNLIFVNYYNDSLRICAGLGNTIFSFDHEKAIYPRYNIDYGKYRDSDNKNSTSSENPGRPITINSHYYIENDNFLFLYVQLGEYAHEPFVGKRWVTFDRVVERKDAYGLFNKKTGEFTLLNQPVKGIPGFRDDILKGPPVVVHHLSGDNTGSQMILATDFKEYVSKNSTSPQLKKIADNLKDEDNPVIALIKVR